MTDKDKGADKPHIERIKRAYIKTSQALVDLTIDDVIDTIGEQVDKAERYHLEHWALVYKFDRALAQLVDLRADMQGALIAITKIKAGVQQAQQLAFTNFPDQQSFDTTPLPNSFLNDSTPPIEDTKK